MQKIPSFTHPSNAKLVSVFRQPNVSDAMSFLDLSSDHEEAVTTDYLNQLLVESSAGMDSKKWTAADRRTALWWLFINIMPDTELTFSYECEHCGGTHVVDYNLVELDSEITVKKILPKLERHLSFAGRKLLVKSQPVTGEGALKLEDYRHSLVEALEADDQQRVELIRSHMKILDAALHVEIDGMNVDERLELIDTLTIPEMIRFFHFAESVKQELHHGLHTQLQDGRYMVVSTPLPCDTVEGKSTRLLMPFRSHDFIPAV